MGFRVYDASPRYIYQTKFGYCFRFVFPSDLRRIISKKELRFSLKTRDQSRAKALSRRLAGFIQNFCSNLRDLATTKGEYAVCRDQTEISELVKTYFHSVIDGDFKSSLKAEIMASRLFNSDQPMEYPCPSDPQPETVSFQAPAPELPTETIKPTKSQPVESPALSEVISLYMNEQIRGGNWTEKTRQEYESACGLLKDIIGDLPVSDIGHQEMQTYKQTLLKLPSHMKTSPKYKGKTVKQLLAMDIEKSMSITNVNKLLTRASSLFSYAVRNGYMPSNPASGLQIRQKKRTDELRSIFTKDDLEKLLISEEYVDGKHPYPYCFWMPLLALHTGCRLEELAQLHTEDIKKVDGIGIIDINNNGDKRIKTKSAIRQIPLHPVLTRDLKFPDFVRSLKTSGEKRLFPELPKRRDGYGVKASRWFNKRYKVKCLLII